MKRYLLALLVCALTLSGCAPEASRGAAGFAPGEENRLVIYTSHKEEIYKPIIQEFEDRTGIWVQVQSGGTNEMLEQIALESDFPQADLMFGGGVESLEAFSEHFTAVDIPEAEAVADKYRLPGSKWLPFSSLPVVLIYNPKLIGDSIPAGWESLLDPVYRGRIAFARPDVSGSSYTALATLLQALPGDDDELLRRFFENLGGNILSGSGEVVGAVSDGSCLVGITLEETAKKGIAAGEDIAMAYPAEGTSDVPDGVAVLKGCAHLQNAEAFISFILGRDVQKRLIDRYSRRSVRADLIAEQSPNTDMKTIDYDILWAGGQKSAILKRWSELAQGAEP